MSFILSDGKPDEWGFDPGFVDPDWAFAWDVDTISAGAVWGGGGDVYDLAANKIRTWFSNAPDWDQSGEFLGLRFNDTRNAECILLDSEISAKLDGMTEFTYLVYLIFNGTGSADEDNIGFQWNTLQGARDDNAKRIIFRYDSTNNNFDGLLYDIADRATTFADLGLIAGVPTPCVLRYFQTNVSCFVGGVKSATTGSVAGPLQSASHSKVPEVMGGHRVTGDDSGIDSPRMTLLNWMFSTRAWTDAEIFKWMDDPFGPIRMADETPLFVPVVAAGTIAKFGGRHRMFG